MNFDDIPWLDTLLFSSETRLHELVASGPLDGLMVEAWSQHESLNSPWTMHLSALSTQAALDIDAMLAQPLTLRTRTVDGGSVDRCGIVMAAEAEEADGGLARYRLTVQPWLALLAHTRRSQVWQERSVVEIVESVFGLYSAQAAWRWAACVDAHLARSPQGAGGRRSYCVQYRETDLDFITRLLAEEGLNYRFETAAEAPLGHQLVIFADSTDAQSCPDDATSASPLGGAGIRFHRASSQEAQDAIQAFGGERRLASAEVLTLAWDYKAKRVLAGGVPTVAAMAGPQAPRLQSYDVAGAYAFTDSWSAERAAELMMQSLEARHKRWLGRGTVRSFSAGTRFELTQSTLDNLAALAEQAQDAAGGTANPRQFLLTAVTHAGINNLPKDASARIARSLGSAGADLLAQWVSPALREQAAQSGYANDFEASRAAVPWRPALQDEHGLRLNAKPTGCGHLSATVVGPDGQAEASGADELHMDALGRIRIQYAFQRQGAQAEGTSTASTWVRVAQPMAGAGMGLQFIPRIGQEVLVQLLDNDIRTRF